MTVTAPPIEAKRLPRRALVDSSVLSPAFGVQVDSDDEAAYEFVSAMIANGRELLVSTLTVAELRKRGSAGPPRVRGLLIVPFDLQCAEILADAFPGEIFREFSGDQEKTRLGVKYDALIVATGLRHRVDCLVSGDKRQRNLADRVGLEAREAGSWRAS